VAIALVLGTALGYRLKPGTAEEMGQSAALDERPRAAKGVILGSAEPALRLDRRMPAFPAQPPAKGRR
jgi:hypothetical protein